MFVGESGAKYSSRWYFITSIKSSTEDVVHSIDVICQKDTLRVVEPLSEHKLNKHSPYEESRIYIDVLPDSYSSTDKQVV